MGRREQNKARKRNELERAALDLFLEQGYAATSIEQIVAEAGIARGTFYLYFADKEELFRAIIDRMAIPALEIIEQCHHALVNATNLAETQQAYRALEVELVRLFVEHASIALLYLREQRNGGVVGDWLRSLQRRIDTFVTEMTASLMERGLMRKTEPAVVAHAIAGAIERITFDVLLDASRMPDPGTIGEELVRLFGEGLVATA